MMNRLTFLKNETICSSTTGMFPFGDSWTVLLGLIVLFLMVLVISRILRLSRIGRLRIHARQNNDSVTKALSQGSLKLPLSYNAPHSETAEIVVRLKRFASKRGMRVIYPGSMKAGKENSPTTIILIGLFGLLLIRCYGFGGYVAYDPEKRVFVQTLNEKKRVILNPFHSMQKEYTIAKSVLEESGYSKVPVRAVSVFTMRSLILEVPEGRNIFTRAAFFNELSKMNYLSEDNDVPVPELTKQILENIRGLNNIAKVKHIPGIPDTR